MAGESRDQGWYRSLLDSTSDVILVLDGAAEIRYVNETVEDVLGYATADMLGRSAFEFVHPEDEPAVAEEFLDFTTGEGPDEPTIVFQVRKADDEWCYVESTGRNQFRDGETDGYVVSLREVTERRRRRQELARYETIIETAPLGLLVLDEEGVITWSNDEYAALLDIPRAELVGTPFMDLVEADYYDESVVEEYLDQVRELLSDRNDVETTSYAVETRPPDGEPRIHEAHVTLLPLSDGEFQGTVIAYRDVTKQREYETELERQNERLDRFASTVSHDLRNPLSVAKGRVDLVEETDDLEHLEHVRKAHDRMESLIDRLLSLARYDETGDLQEVLIGDAAREAWKAVDAGDASLEVDADGRVLADPTRLRQIFENLFRNAVEHGSTSSRPSTDDAVEHGSTSDGTSDDDRESLTVTVGELHDGAGFFVEDDGPGVPPADRERVFEYGYSTSEDGTGFGLDIVETVVAAHGWTVSLTDGEEGGARFEMTTQRTDEE